LNLPTPLNSSLKIISDSGFTDPRLDGACGAGSDGDTVHVDGPGSDVEGRGSERVCGFVDGPGSDVDGPEPDGGYGLVDGPGSDGGYAHVDGPGSDGGYAHVDGPGSDGGYVHVDGPGSDGGYVHVDGPGSDGRYGLLDGPGSESSESSDGIYGLFDDPGSGGGAGGGWSFVGPEIIRGRFKSRPKLPCGGGGRLGSCDGDELRDFGNSNTDISCHAEGEIVTSDSDDVSEAVEKKSSVK
jgi:hypothetical protein